MVLDSDSLTDALTTQLSSDASVSRFMVSSERFILRGVIDDSFSQSPRKTQPSNFTSLSSKKLPPLPTNLPRNSHVHFVDDPPYGQ